MLPRKPRIALSALSLAFAAALAFAANNAAIAGSLRTNASGCHCTPMQKG